MFFSKVLNMSSPHCFGEGLRFSSQKGMSHLGKFKSDMRPTQYGLGSGKSSSNMQEKESGFGLSIETCVEKKSKKYQIEMQFPNALAVIYIQMWTKL